MKHDLELSLQAWLDGELPEKKARQMAEWVARDAEAGALVAELRSIKEAFPLNETPRSVPDSREFYWSQIERRLQQPTATPAPARLSWLARWQAYLLPITGVAAVACALVVTTRHSHAPTFDEISATSNVMEAVTFHDQSGQMTVVWLQDSSPASTPATPNLQSPTKTTDESDGELD